MINDITNLCTPELSTNWQQRARGPLQGFTYGRPNSVALLDLLLIHHNTYAPPHPTPIPSSTTPLPLLQRRKLPHKMRRTLIPAWILIQIQLVIILRIPPLPCLQDLRTNRPLLPPLLLHLLRHQLRLLFLLGAMIENSRSVLRAGIHPLAVLGGGVMHLVEELEEGGVGKLGGVECHLKRFGVLIRDLLFCVRA